MSTASASRTIKFVSKGGTYTAMLVGNEGDIYQIYDSTSVYPDFAEKQPTLSLVCTSSRTTGIVSFNYVDWYINDNQISFSGTTNVSTGTYKDMFKRIPGGSGNGNNGYPGLMILQNLIDPESPAPVIIKAVGHFTAGEYNEDITATYNVSARQGNGNSYYATILSESGGYALTSSTPSVTLKAILQQGGINVDSSTLSFEWYKYEMVSGSMQWKQLHRASYGGTTVTGNAQTLVVTDAMVDTYADFKVKVTTSSGVSYEDVQGVVDAQDPYEIHMECQPEDLVIYDTMDDSDGVTFSNIQLVRRGTNEVVSGATFYWNARGSGGEWVNSTAQVSGGSFVVTKAMVAQAGDVVVTITAE